MKLYVESILTFYKIISLTNLKSCRGSKVSSYRYNEELVTGDIPGPQS